MNEGMLNGWRIDFQPNVHMYCHNLTASKGDLELSIPCEDSPAAESLVAIWAYELELDAHVYNDLIDALHAWARSIGLVYRIYVTKDEFESG